MEFDGGLEEEGVGRGGGDGDLDVTEGEEAGDVDEGDKVAGCEVGEEENVEVRFFHGCHGFGLVAKTSLS